MDDFQTWIASVRDAVPQGKEGFFKNNRSITPNRVPALWLKFAQGGESLINQQYDAQRRALAGGRQDYERNLLNTLGSYGVDPIFARRTLAESLPQHQYQYGGIESNRLSDLLDFRSGITNALSESNTSERQLDIQAYLAAKAREAARKGAKSAGNLSLIGAGIGAAGAIGGGYLAGR